jgi:hypothetical protein
MEDERALTKYVFRTLVDLLQVVAIVINAIATVASRRNDVRGPQVKQTKVLGLTAKRLGQIGGIRDRQGVRFRSGLRRTIRFGSVTIRERDAYGTCLGDTATSNVRRFDSNGVNAPVKTDLVAIRLQRVARSTTP